MKSYSLLLLIFGLTISGCSIEIGQATGAAPSPESISVPPVNWAELNLTGRLVYSIVSMDGDISVFSVQTLDLRTGQTKSIFTAEDGAGIYYMTVSPDGKQAILSYVPPLDSASSRNQALYLMPLEGSTPPQLLFTPPTEYDQYIQVEWSPDGKYIYYVHNNYHVQPADQVFPNYEVWRMLYPDGQPEKIADHAFWPGMSSDSSKVVYVSLDPESGKNDLFLASADGSNPQKIVLYRPGTNQIIDAPIFSPDEQTIFFSAPSPVQAHQPNWFELLTGVQIASAHNVPSDWWSVPVTGGKPTQLTHIQSTGLFGSILPDRKHLVSVSSQGLFVMDLDGSNLTLLMPDPGGSTVHWIP